MPAFLRMAAGRSSLRSAPYNPALHVKAHIRDEHQHLAPVGLPQQVDQYPEYVRCNPHDEADAFLIVHERVSA